MQATMEEATKSSGSKNTAEAAEEDLDLNPVGLLQKRHTEPLHSHEVYLVPECQPDSVSAASGANPWTGQTAEEVREAAYSEQQYQQLLHEKDDEEEKEAPVPAAPASPGKEEGRTREEEQEQLKELDEIMFDTAM